jgi:hypothetical protein
MTGGAAKSISGIFLRGAQAGSVFVFLPPALVGLPDKLHIESA